jgi:hypothetical protein
LSDNVVAGSHATTDEYQWRYTIPPADGAKRQLLTRGGVAVHGVWWGALGEAFIAWTPMPRRDRSKEKELFSQR